METPKKNPSPWTDRSQSLEERFAWRPISFYLRPFQSQRSLRVIFQLLLFGDGRVLEECVSMLDWALALRLALQLFTVKWRVCSFGFLSPAYFHKYAHGHAHRHCFLFKSSRPSVSLCAGFFLALPLKKGEKREAYGEREIRAGCWSEVWSRALRNMNLSPWSDSKSRTQTVIYLNTVHLRVEWSCRWLSLIDAAVSLEIWFQIIKWTFTIQLKFWVFTKYLWESFQS